MNRKTVVLLSLSILVGGIWLYANYEHGMPDFYRMNYRVRDIMDLKGGALGPPTSQPYLTRYAVRWNSTTSYVDGQAIGKLEWLDLALWNRDRIQAVRVYAFRKERWELTAREMSDRLHAHSMNSSRNLKILPTSGLETGIMPVRTDLQIHATHDGKYVTCRLFPPLTAETLHVEVIDMRGNVTHVFIEIDRIPK